MTSRGWALQLDIMEKRKRPDLEEERLNSPRPHVFAVLTHILWASDNHKTSADRWRFLPSEVIGL
ncbi:hypothetical protein D0469_09045 [Peribacillus saganii]|uniref:Uncharacterized protein n=1 Tax=Peribacillus saganii TaxID=2303992 RepID=A0A372LPA3_9BACI|nr:hypothetical protein D0469_09045 [Peribacillus saganii]